MEQIKAFFKREDVQKIVKRLGWNILNGFVGLAVVYFTNINWVYAPVVIAICNGITKEINKILSAK